MSNERSSMKTRNLFMLPGKKKEAVSPETVLLLVWLRTAVTAFDFITGYVVLVATPVLQKGSRLVFSARLPQNFG